MKKKIKMSLHISLIFFSFAIFGILVLQAAVKNQQVIDQVLKSYQVEMGKEAKDFSAKRGLEMWTKNYLVKGKQKNCADCHGTDLTKVGKHERSGKKIEPMAAWTTPDRYTDVKKIEKWFKRNCKGTWGRECTPQEKGDFLEFFRKPLK